MKNIETMLEMLSANREQFFQRRRELEENLATLEKIYGDGLRHDCTPVQTVSDYVDAVGYNDAVEIIASLVNRSAWDGRISAAVKAWAAEQETAWDEEACAKLRLYSDRIHMAHLDQIAAAMMEYTPESATETENPMTLEKLVGMGIVSDHTKIIVRFSTSFRVFAHGEWFCDGIIPFLRTPIQAFTWQDDNCVDIEI